MSSEERLKLAIAEDNDEFRHTLRDIISYEPDMQVVALWRSGHEVLAEIDAVQPDILLLDISMPFMDGVATVRHLTERGCPTKVIMLTMHDDEEIVLESLRNGAASYLVKDGSVEQIILAIREVSKGRGLVHPQVTQILLHALSRQTKLNDSWKDVLTAREYDVLKQLTQGKSNEQIAEALHITVKTVKNHVSHILAKMGVADRSQAVLYAVRRRWVLL
ncbi:response regulator [Alicyclobacillus fodiniaquatilis]|jgi:DNA-binding NarL/FixJ family response regulator|uniref:Response regulator n=1 Tax=Alicyclobacillus fodiniaquatilis TaxID=1661150 RepID=A0ABW4JGN8_9BACL